MAIRLRAVTLRNWMVLKRRGVAEIVGPVVIELEVMELEVIELEVMELLLATIVLEI